MTKVKFSDLQGKALKSIKVSDDKERVEIECDDGKKFVMQHHQDCCESVAVEDVIGDLADLIGTPILLAEEAVSDKEPEGFKHEYQPESQTWTFYKLRTIKGSVDIRWYGNSNGYYSESVNFDEVK